MPASESRFLQIHSLVSYPGTLLNRDDAGMAKRLPVGGTSRIRISSQSLKRHWRRAEDDHAIGRLGTGLAVRSREIFPRLVRQPLVEEGLDSERIDATFEPIMEELLGKSAKAKADKAKKGDAAVKTEQVIILGRPEIEFIKDQVRRIATGAASPADAKARAERLVKEEKANFQAINVIAQAGIDAALFGRMVTSDMLARGDAAIHVAHAFSVNEDADEPDYFSAVDDLTQAAGELGSGHINASELTAGLFYVYVVVDLPQLVSNLTGCDRQDWAQADRGLAAEVVESLVHLIATVSPGAKLGSTAPYAASDLMLIEAGRRQPRTLGNAFLTPIRPGRDGLRRAATAALSRYLASLDRCYGAEARGYLAVEGADLPSADDKVSLAALASWAAALVRGAA